MCCYKQIYFHIYFNLSFIIFQIHLIISYKVFLQFQLIILIINFYYVLKHIIFLIYPFLHSILIFLFLSTESYSTFLLFLTPNSLIPLKSITLILISFPFHSLNSLPILLIAFLLLNKQPFYFLVITISHPFQ